MLLLLFPEHRVAVLHVLNQPLIAPLCCLLAQNSNGRSLSRARDAAAPQDRSPLLNGRTAIFSSHTLTCPLLKLCTTFILQSLPLGMLEMKPSSEGKLERRSLKYSRRIFGAFWPSRPSRPFWHSIPFLFRPLVSDVGWMIRTSFRRNLSFHRRYLYLVCFP